MVEEGAALAIMGNHEFNAICYATEHDGSHVREHNEKNTGQHAAFLHEFPFGSAEHEAVIGWFKTLPIAFDAEGMIAVHACWCDASLAALKPYTDERFVLSDEGYLAYSEKGSREYDALETLLKGPEAELPEALHFHDKDGNPRNKARLRWWVNDDAPASEKLEFGGAKLSETQQEALDDVVINDASRVTDKPVFFGHYWLKSEPRPLNSKAACLDYSVAKGGKLVAYRWNGEDVLRENSFVWC